MDALAAGREGLPPRAHAELQAWAYGTLRWWPRIERQLAALSARPLDELDPLALALLGVRSFRFSTRRFRRTRLWMNRSRRHASWLRARQRFRQRFASPLLRERASIDARALAAPAGRFAHPDWLIECIRNDWPDDYARMLDANNEHPPLWLRVNERKIEVDAYLRSLNDAGLDAQRAPRIPTALRLDKAVGVDAIPGFAEGKVSVQDAGAQLAAPLLDARSGHRVLDACAAPGGKTCHIAERTADLATLLAIDRDADRVELIRENLDRLGLSATLAAADATKPAQWWDGRPFDRILLDVPCSATGVVRRHPDIKILRRPEDIPVFARLQMQLLVGALAVTRPWRAVCLRELLDTERGKLAGHSRFSVGAPGRSRCTAGSGAGRDRSSARRGAGTLFNSR